MSEIEKLQIELLKLEIEHKKQLNYIELRQKFSEAYVSIRRHTPTLEKELDALGKKLFKKCFK